MKAVIDDMVVEWLALLRRTPHPQWFIDYIAQTLLVNPFFITLEGIHSIQCARRASAIFPQIFYCISLLSWL